MKIFISSDHRGFEIKNKIINYLTKKNIKVEDCGAYIYNPEDDYTDFVVNTMEKMKTEPGNLSVIICRNGGGVSIVANKFKHIRCAISFNKNHTQSLRTDDNINVLALPVNFIDEDVIYEIIEAFLNTNFSSEERHTRRLEKLSLLENKNFKE